MQNLIRALGFLSMLIALGVLFVMLVLRLLNGGQQLDYPWIAWPIIIMYLLLEQTSLTGEAIREREYFQIIMRFQHMEAIFVKGARMIRAMLQANDTSGALAWLRRLGRESLLENGDWVLFHREPQVEVPHP